MFQEQITYKPPPSSPIPGCHGSEWSEMFPYDFRDERMMRSLKEVTQNCASLSPVSSLTPHLSPPLTLCWVQELRKLVGQLQAALVKKLSVLDKYEHVLAQVNAVSMERLIDPKTQVFTPPPPPPLMSDLWQVNILTVCESPQELAQQLTHIELVSSPSLPLYPSLSLPPSTSLPPSLPLSRRDSTT